MSLHLLKDLPEFSLKYQLFIVAQGPQSPFPRFLLVTPLPAHLRRGGLSFPMCVFSPAALPSTTFPTSAGGKPTSSMRCLPEPVSTPKPGAASPPSRPHTTFSFAWENSLADLHPGLGCASSLVLPSLISHVRPKVTQGQRLLFSVWSFPQQNATSGPRKRWLLGICGIEHNEGQIQRGGTTTQRVATHVLIKK